MKNMNGGFFTKGGNKVKSVYWDGHDLNSEEVKDYYDIEGKGDKVVRLRKTGTSETWIELSRQGYDGRVERGEIIPI